MQVSNPRRFMTLLIILAVIVIAFVVFVIIKPFSSSNNAPTGTPPSTSAGVPRSVTPNPNQPTVPVKLPKTVTRILAASNAAKFVVIRGDNQTRELARGVGTATLVNGTLETLVKGTTVYDISADCYDKLSAPASIIPTVQSIFFTPFGTSRYTITHRGAISDIRWHIAQPTGSSMQLPSGSFVTNARQRIISAVATTGGHSSHYTISYPKSLHLPAAPTKICRTAAATATP